MLMNANCLSTGILLKMIPGPSRKREPAIYQYRVTFRNPLPDQPGCVMTWEVLGGRLPYQVALERRDDGGVNWHCTCADAVYRGELSLKHVCKHAKGLMECTPAQSRKRLFR
jgi:hypothetical protein